MLHLIVITALLVGADQAIKSVMSALLAPYGNIVIIPGIVEFRYVENSGAAFSMLAGKQIFLIVVTSVALLAIIYILLFKKPERKLEYWGYLLILSGGIGNLVDRIRQGYVVDYINFLFIKFAVFNLADIFVTFGFVILLISIIRSSDFRQKGKHADLTGSSNG